jgi:hypothetical protein
MPNKHMQQQQLYFMLLEQDNKTPFLKSHMMYEDTRLERFS